MCKPLLNNTLFALGFIITASAHAGAPKTEIINSLQQMYVYVPAGEFTMGTVEMDDLAFELPDGNLGRVRDETPAHRVQISQGFYLANTEVTQGHWWALMGTRPGPESNWKHADWSRLPVVSISWDMSQSFIKRINEQEPGRRYRLPTEAEWEYAARAGSQGLRPFPAEELSEHAWYIENSADKPQPVASKTPNAWGFYDLLGNAWEWVEDRYLPNTYTSLSRADPKGPEQGAKRVRRGGSYHCKPHMVRPAYRAADFPDTRYSVMGFRLVLDPVSDQEISYP